MGYNARAISGPLLFLLFISVIHIRHADADAALSFVPTKNGIKLSLSRGDTEKLVGTIGLGYDFTAVKCIGRANCTIGDTVLDVTFTAEGFEITWTSESSNNKEFKDCFDLKKGELNWYGGPERWSQKWPVEKLTIDKNDPYVIKKSDNFAVAERYWLNSLGAYIFLDDRVPLYVDQNFSEDGKVCFTANLTGPYINRTRTILKYAIVALDNPKEAHLHAINNYLGKPSGYPDERMVREPIWTTWAKYKRDITDETVLEFAQDILDHGFDGGQLEIDDDWERCYGAQEFKSTQFADIKNTVSKLKQMNFRVSLWVHPFVNSDCESVASYGVEKDFFVKNTTGHSKGVWWNGLSAYQIDFTNPHAARWYAARLNKLRYSPGIDSFKFDAGEVDYSPQPATYPNVDQELIPNILTGSYIRHCSKFGRLIEARSAWRTQDLPVFTRMIDKDSSWTLDNGLYSLITTLLQMNMNGYPFVLPDMIGGNGYNYNPTVELIIRWTQANVFMPSMQFSYLPWDVASNETSSADIVKKFVDLHKNYSAQIIEAMQASVKNGSPVNPPIWWIDPTDPIALATDDEFLLGENILVAPVITEGATSKNVYLPKGTWKDGNSDATYEGPTSIKDYPAPLDTLPYFIKQ
ncbi:myogenesis-regulating glycosidase-like [Anoplophora glabripennis]|uniref:myogenesis-regulating glycosidase-like n=1 Tax=Anoplophora glabripennis TaxID=217634 RepID=UPI000874FCF1|nr:myogenesis-regulating glycosidase-like [Anoplophora glabripennis]